MNKSKSSSDSALGNLSLTPSVKDRHSALPPDSALGSSPQSTIDNRKSQIPPDFPPPPGQWFFPGDLPRPKVVSQEQRLANQQNAQKCTGPKTVEGKANSSRNSLKHGLLAKSVVVDTPTGPELRSDFDSLLADMCEELEPVGLIEQTLVERIATCYWRLNRAQRYETGCVQKSLEAVDDETDDRDKLRKKLRAAKVGLAAINRLGQILDKPDGQRTDDEKIEINELKDKVPKDIIRQVIFETYDINLGPGIDNLKDRLPVMRTEQEAMIANLRDDLRRCKKEEESRRNRCGLLGSLPDGDSIMKVIRYETMIDRQLHRALNEFRRVRNARV